MIKRIIGKNGTFSFDFDLEENEQQGEKYSGKLYRGTNEKTGEHVIIRYIADNALIKNEEHREIIQTVLNGINSLHTGVVKSYDCINDNDGVYFVREMLNGIDLRSIAFSGDYPHLRNRKFLMTVAIKVCETLQSLHLNKIVHRRIQPSTIFIATNAQGQIDTENPNVKILNPEYAQINGQNLLSFSTIPYTLYYSAPELVLQTKQIINASCDLYSLGISLYEAFSRKHAFECENEDKNLILNMQLAYPIQKNPRIDKDIFELLYKATSKHIFKTPPMRYKPEARLKFLYTAQKQRFQNALDMKDHLLLLLNATQEKKSLFFWRKKKDDK